MAAEAEATVAPASACGLAGAAAVAAEAEADAAPASACGLAGAAEPGPDGAPARSALMSTVLPRLSAWREGL